jgi:hypothetical protein
LIHQNHPFQVNKLVELSLTGLEEMTEWDFDPFVNQITLRFYLPVKKIDWVEPVMKKRP